MRTAQDFTKGQELVPKSRLRGFRGCRRVVELLRNDTFQPCHMMEPIRAFSINEDSPIILTVLQMRKLRHMGVERIDWRWW